MTIKGCPFKAAVDGGGGTELPSIPVSAILGILVDLAVTCWMSDSLEPIAHGGSYFECPFAPVHTLGHEPYGDVLPLPNMIVQKRGQKWTRVKTINDLGGFVRIRTREDALSFVRLQTLPEYAFKTGCLLYEIHSVESVDTRFTLGDSGLVASLKSSGAGFFGFVPKSWMSKLSSTYPQVRADHHSWIITRLLLRSDDNIHFIIHRVRERVGQTGKYKVIADMVVSLPPPPGGWHPTPSPL